MTTRIWQKIWAAVARWVPHWPSTLPDHRERSSAFQTGLAESLRRLQASREDLSRQRERLRQRNQGGGVAVGGGCGLRSITRFEAMTRRPGVTIDEIKQAFRHLAMTCHPDHGGNPALFSRLCQAYQVSVARALDGQPCPA